MGADPRFRFRVDQPGAADRQAWEAAYDAVGDDRIFPADALWEAFLARNTAEADFTCAADIAETSGAVRVSADAARARRHAPHPGRAGP